MKPINAMKNKIVWTIGLALALGLAQQGGAQEKASIPKEVVETVVVELGPDGFYPREILRKTRDKFHLFVRVTLGEEQVPLRVDNASGVAVKQTELPRQSRRWNQLLDIAPGKYFLRVPGKANQVLNITIP
jgi:hypothetical protein